MHGSVEASNHNRRTAVSGYLSALIAARSALFSSFSSRAPHCSALRPEPKPVSGSSRQKQISRSQIPGVRRWILPALGCAALAITSYSQAAVIVYFEQVGSDVVATWTGSIDVKPTWTREVGFGFPFRAAQAEQFGAVAVGGVMEQYGEFSPTVTAGGTATPTSLSGVVDSFTRSVAFNGVLFYIEGVADGLAPVSSVYHFDSAGFSQTFEDDTLANIGADAFNNTLAWTAFGNGPDDNFIRYTTVPEPSCIALLGVGALALVIRRR